MNWILLLLIVCGLCNAIGGVVTRAWPATNNFWYAVAGLLLFNLASAAWLWALHRGGSLCRGSVIVGMLVLLIETMGGVVLFKERLTPVQWSGVVLALIAVLLIEG